MLLTIHEVHILFTFPFVHNLEKSETFGTDPPAGEDGHGVAALVGDEVLRKANKPEHQGGSFLEKRKFRESVTVRAILQKQQECLGLDNLSHQIPSFARAVKKKTEQIQKCKLLIWFPSRLGHSN